MKKILEAKNKGFKQAISLKVIKYYYIIILMVSLKELN